MVSARREGGSWQTVSVNDEELLALAEQALTEIKVNQGLSEHHASVLAALRIRLKGSDMKSLDALLEAADESGSRSLEDAVAEAESASDGKPSLDELLATPKPKPDWPT